MTRPPRRVRRARTGLRHWSGLDGVHQEEPIHLEAQVASGAGDLFTPGYATRIDPYIIQPFAFIPLHLEHQCTEVTVRVGLWLGGVLGSRLVSFGPHTNGLRW